MEQAKCVINILAFHKMMTKKKRDGWMGKGSRFLLGLALLAGIFSGCRACEQEERIADMEYTVLRPEEVPEELANKIEHVKEEEFQLSYDDGEYLYMAKGYGKRNSSGFQISVKDVYITEHNLVLDTEITGPKEGQDVVEKKTTPYIVVKMETIEKQVVFE